MSNPFKMNQWKSYSSGLNPVTKYCNDHSTAMSEDEKNLVEKTMAEPNSGMLGSSDQLHLLAGICRAMGAKKTLDIGVFTGFSSLCIAKSLPDDGKVIACDITDKYLEKYCNPAWIEGGVRHKIDFRVGPATDTLKSLIDDGQEGTFDFAFIDADKPSYDQYFELSLRLLRPSGMIALDNVLRSGSVLPDSGASDDITISLRKLNEKLKSDDRVDVTMIMTGDGTTIAVKK